ncbi:MAG TPA: hypothetical protein PL155_03900 [Candidatus Omnitrophota bacterium]|nr:hypothetical protein [Candidatus Omnitrophota bacterium]HPD84382.1 hypothetical protein [Candidatus Omnitrophota bacterium]HRZ03240.1 hypothetical protein [Candidatus Omnitrophota bacterium]
MIKSAKLVGTGGLRAVILYGFFLSGCSTVNFSANYYTPPENYQYEIVQLWQKLQVQLKLQDGYKVNLIEGKDANKQKGIPFISGQTVFLPKDFVKYVYQNYYDDRFKILTNVIAHEVCHPEYNLPSKPPDEHAKTDFAAIKLLGSNAETAEYYYKSLYVMRNYWFARKGMAGHALNAGWNMMSAASLVFGGPTFFMDLYATDLDRRMKLISKEYKLSSNACFKQTHETIKN